MTRVAIGKRKYIISIYLDPLLLPIPFITYTPLLYSLSPSMPDMSAIAIPQQRQFNPYAENGGTILAIAGADFTVIAGDTRQSDGYNIQTRYAPKVFRLSV
jgi:Proteasome subunit